MKDLTTIFQLLLISLAFLGIDYLLLVVVFGVSKGWIAGFFTFGTLVAASSNHPLAKRWHSLVFLASFIAYIWVFP